MFGPSVVAIVTMNVIVGYELQACVTIQDVFFQCLTQPNR